jgi:hypothetical protein
VAVPNITSMKNLVTVLTVFTSSPSDVLGERLALVRAIERINRLSYIRNQFVIRPYQYEETPPLAGETPQMVVDQACSIRECYLVVCILWRWMGTPFVHPVTNQSYLSGTEYEFLTAYGAYLSLKQPHILLYRKIAHTEDLPESSRSDQIKLVEAFFSKFEEDKRELQGLYVPFTTTEEFEERILHDILNHLYDYPPTLQPEAQLPSFIEEERRLDVAIPQEARPNDTIELWVKICTKESPGLRKELHDNPKAPGVPSLSDTRNEFMSVAFERTDQSDSTSPLQTIVEIISMDFKPLEGTRFIELHIGIDSPTIVFPLRVATQEALGYVQVRIKTKSIHADYWIENSSLSCQVQIRRVPVLSKILSFFSASPQRSTIGIEMKMKIESVAKQVKLIEKEVETVNTLKKAFTSIMEEGTAIRNKDHLRKIRIELQWIKKESELKIKRIKSEEGKKYLNQIIKATDRNIDGLIPIERQFEEQEHDKSIIEMQSALFNNFVNDIKNGNIKVTSRWSCDGYISDINKKIELIRGICIYTVNSEAAKKVLNQIISNWESLRKQFEDLKYRNF